MKTRVDVEDGLRTGWLPAYVLRMEGGLRAVMRCDAHAETVNKTGDWNRDWARKLGHWDDPRKEASGVTY